MITSETWTTPSNRTPTTPFNIVVPPTDPGEAKDTDTFFLGDTFNGSIMAVNFLLAAMAIPLNIAIMTYFWPRVKQLVPFTYFVLSTSDLLTAISGALTPSSS